MDNIKVILANYDIRNPTPILLVQLSCYYPYLASTPPQDVVSYSAFMQLNHLQRGMQLPG